ncbi:hypothetical protein NQZ68_010496 [Dissostichus eleginoides]|nr:hypothetical protein NQZ68_010496 [Dissostichus eleginoides]
MARGMAATYLQVAFLLALWKPSLQGEQQSFEKPRYDIIACDLPALPPHEELGLDLDRGGLDTALEELGLDLDPGGLDTALEELGLDFSLEEVEELILEALDQEQVEEDMVVQDQEDSDLEESDLEESDQEQSDQEELGLAPGQEAVEVEEFSEQEASGLAEVAMEATEGVMVRVLVNTQELVELVPNLLKQVIGLEVQELGLAVLGLGLVVQELGLAVLGLGLAVLGLGLVVLGLGLGVQELGLAVQDLGLEELELGLAVQGLGLEELELGLAVQGLGLAVQELGLAVLELGLALQELGLAVLGLGLAVQELGLAVLELVVQELGLVVLGLGLAVLELGLAVLELAVQELGLAVLGLGLEEFQCCRRLAQQAEVQEGRAVVKHQNKFQDLGCRDSIKVDMYQAKVLEAAVFSLEWPQEMDLDLRLGLVYLARGVLDQEGQAVELELVEVLLVEEVLWGLGPEDSQEEELESHQDLEVMVQAQPKLANMEQEDQQGELELAQESDLALGLVLVQVVPVLLLLEEQEEELELAQAGDLALGLVMAQVVPVPGQVV